MTKISVNYMADNSDSSLFRNGKVLIKRDVDGSDADSKGVNLTNYELNLLNAREYKGEQTISLNANGFELAHNTLNNSAIDFFDNQQIIKSYYPECAEIIKEKTDANRVFVFDHNIRSATGKKNGKRIAGGQLVQGPAHVVHGDYTLKSAPDRIEQLSNPLGENDTLQNPSGKNNGALSKNLVRDIRDGRRFSIINLWRNIVTDPVEVNPIGLCDASTVSTNDLVVFEIHYDDRVGENYFAKYNKKHQWYYYPKMTRDEALLIKQWDSLGGFAHTNGKSSDYEVPQKPSTFSFHSAFNDPNAKHDAPDRWSIEVRCVVVY